MFYLQCDRFRPLTIARKCIKKNVSDKSKLALGAARVGLPVGLGGCPRFIQTRAASVKGTASQGTRLRRCLARGTAAPPSPVAGRRDAPPLPSAAAPPLKVAPASFRLPTPAEVATGPARTGHYWPGDGWVRGTVVLRSRAQGSRFSHVVRYGPRSVLGVAMVDSLLDVASHGQAGRCVPPTR